LTAASYALRNAQVDGNSRRPAGVLDGAHVVSIVLDYDAFLGVFSQCTHLLQWRIAFDPVLLERSVSGDQQL
jgi:hypothetical protein